MYTDVLQMYYFFSLYTSAYFNNLGVYHNRKFEPDLNEFINAAVEQYSYFREEELLETFKIIDLDGSGKLSKMEIKTALLKDDKVSDETVDKLVKEFDLNSDGEIDYNEFLLMMEKISIIPIKIDESLPTK